MDYRRLSKAMAHALRHRPDLYGLVLDNAGWTPLPDLVRGLQERGWRHITETDVLQVLSLPGKKRYEVKNGRIRALYGHSIKQRIEKETAVPPPILYHGTAPQTTKTILQEGLKPMKRQYVHLSVDIETAIQVGRRKTNHPAILQIAAQKAHQAGINFYKGHEEIWLADSIPPEFIEIITTHGENKT
ncbi:MAG: RNA 2'-phosphotransferase [Chloroflexi bacterium]|nr:MAG: RNA 2'-phosphotransferase [Chloroflexota bacterium]